MTIRFDEQYYQRFYLDPSTRVYDQPRHACLVTGIVSLIEWFGGDLDEVLDVGAGLGWWGQWLKHHRPRTRVTSTEMNPDICRKYGHLQADITRWRSPDTFDLVICQGVLPYLSDEGLQLAVDNLAAMSRGFLYLEAITTEDYKSSIDAERTDLRVTLRKSSIYKKLLKPYFREVGAGLWASRASALPFFSLEAQR